MYVYIYIYDIISLRVKENRGYWKLKEDAIDRALWRTGSGRGYGPVVGRPQNE